uniref:Uncharacterized protein n=1 Tax=Chromera velia CCMP2878 TaxID=1169474 RepID=A0A0G4HTA8_9ALVE|eukprot:Cvel_8405.t1-p1 / transcript=Cvel_8405.t1 / gene=Cvel_8405 / organism=Chromera_velia_CCMP2878 / gene_product=hypothetical protein / transcript_product=hypothetical protein / location=Cvel_scaffold464:14104-20607(+) / protein_length=560 / sequence_SO=supercontig / SO=protein_coding / is_pseudo=false
MSFVGAALAGTPSTTFDFSQSSQKEDRGTWEVQEGSGIVNADGVVFFATPQTTFDFVLQCRCAVGQRCRREDMHLGGWTGSSLSSREGESCSRECVFKTSSLPVLCDPERSSDPLVQDVVVEELIDERVLHRSEVVLTNSLLPATLVRSFEDRMNFLGFGLPNQIGLIARESVTSFLTSVAEMETAENCTAVMVMSRTLWGKAGVKLTFQEPVSIGESVPPPPKVAFADRLSMAAFELHYCSTSFKVRRKIRELLEDFFEEENARDVRRLRPLILGPNDRLSSAQVEVHFKMVGSFGGPSFPSGLMNPNSTLPVNTRGMLAAVSFLEKFAAAAKEEWRACDSPMPGEPLVLFPWLSEEKGGASGQEGALRQIGMSLESAVETLGSNQRQMSDLSALAEDLVEAARMHLFEEEREYRANKEKIGRGMEGLEVADDVKGRVSFWSKFARCAVVDLFEHLIGGRETVESTHSRLEFLGSHLQKGREQFRDELERAFVRLELTAEDRVKRDGGGSTRWSAGFDHCAVRLDEVSKQDGPMKLQTERCHMNMMMQRMGLFNGTQAQ